MAAGAADVVRGASAPPEELLFIAQHSGAVGALLQDGAALDRMLAAAEQHSARVTVGRDVEWGLDGSGVRPGRGWRGERGVGWVCWTAGAGLRLYTRRPLAVPSSYACRTRLAHSQACRR